MKTSNKLNVLVMLATLASCGKNNTEGLPVVLPKLAVETSSVLELDHSEDLKMWSDLFLDPSKFNPVMGTVLAPVVVAKERSYLSNKLELSGEELKSLEEELTAEEKQIRYRLLNVNSAYTSLQTLKESIVPYNSEGAFISNREAAKLLYAAKLRDEYIKQILKTYEETISKNSQEIAPFVSREISRLDPQGAQSILDCILSNRSEQTCISQIETVIKALESGRDFFADSNLNSYEQGSIVLAGAGIGSISYYVYLELKQSKKWPLIAYHAEKAKEAYEKYKEVKVLVQSMESYAQSMKKDIIEFANTSKALSEDISREISSAKRKLSDPNVSFVDKKKTLQFLKDKLNGKELSVGETNIFSSPVSVGENVQKFVKSAGKISTNFNLILNTTQSLAKAFNVKLPKEVSKVMQTAQKVNAAVSLAQDVMSGLAKGGALGAFQAIISGPGASLLGANVETFESRTMKEFEKINVKLDEIKKLAEEIKSLQIVTLSQIKDLAVMVHEYHQELMDELFDLRLMAARTDNKVDFLQTKNLMSCQSFISGALSITSFGANIAHAPSVASQMKDFLMDANLVRNNIAAAGQLTPCNSGLEDVFDIDKANHLLEDEIATGANGEILDTNRRLYRPLLSFFENDNFSYDLGLHLPVKNVKDAKYPRIYGSRYEMDVDQYQMKTLISTEKLEQYSSLLVVLQPFLNVQPKFWETEVSAMMREHAKVDWKVKSGKTRAHEYLRKSLLLIQSGISQEAILAGEPILHKLSSSINKVLNLGLRVSDCRARSQDHSSQCAILMNPLLLRNVMKLSFYKRQMGSDAALSEYREAYKNNDFSMLSKMILGFDHSTRFVSKDGKVFFTSLLKTDGSEAVTLVRVPTPLEMEDGKIEYRENVSRLLQMQEVLINEISQYELDGLTQDSKMILLKKTLMLSM